MPHRDPQFHDDGHKRRRASSANIRPTKRSASVAFIRFRVVPHRRELLADRQWVQLSGCGFESIRHHRLTSMPLGTDSNLRRECPAAEPTLENATRDGGSGRKFECKRLRRSPPVDRCFHHLNCRDARLLGHAVLLAQALQAGLRLQQRHLHLL